VQFVSFDEGHEVPMFSSALRGLTTSLVLAVVAVLALLASSAHAARKQGPAAHNISFDSVNNAEWRRGTVSAPLLVKLQVLLDRAHASPW
jgi:hypothetical protein